MQNKTNAKMTLSQRDSGFRKKQPRTHGGDHLNLPLCCHCRHQSQITQYERLSSILLLTLLLSFAAAGQTMVLIGGGLDFTVGAVMSSAAILTTYVMDSQDGRFLLVFALAMVMGAAIGFLNGFCSVKIDLPPMIVTMAISNVVTRMGYVLTQGSPSGYPSPKFVDSVINKIFGFIPSLTLYALVLWPLVFFLLNRSRYGKQLYLMGNNPTAARTHRRERPTGSAS